METIDKGIAIAQEIGVFQRQIWSRGGMKYYPTTVPYWYDKSARYYDPIKSRLIDIPENLIIFGGFNGDDTYRSQKNFVKYPTQISARLPGTDDLERETYQVVNMGANT